MHVNRTPTEIGPVSPESDCCGTALLASRVHGQLSAPDVVKCETNGAVIAVPPVLTAPETVTVYRVDGASGCVGTKVAELVADSPATRARDTLRRSGSVTRDGGALALYGPGEVAVIDVPTGTEVALSAGSIDAT